MTGTTASDNADFALDGCFDVLQDARIFFDWRDQIFVTFRKSFQHVFDDKVRIVNDALQGELMR